MVEHGFRCESKPSAKGGFKCSVCRSVVNFNDPVVAFRNNNRRPPACWDHVHAGQCAEQYKIPKLCASRTVAAAQAVRNAASSVFALLPGQRRPSAPDPLSGFYQKAAQLGFSEPVAAEVLDEVGGDQEAAMRSMAAHFTAEFEAEEAGSSSGAAAAAAGAAEQQSGSDSGSSDELLPPRVAEPPAFTTNHARAAALQVFMLHIKDMIPKPQSDGSFKDGDAGLLDALMASPYSVQKH
jgi:hypothetical protein